MFSLYLDCQSGISGDMFVAALIDLGADPAAIEAELSKLGLSGDFHIHVSRQLRQQISGVKFDVHLAHSHDHPQSPELSQTHDHAHTHSHGHAHTPTHDHTHHDDHAHGRNHREIRELIGGSELSGFVKSRALAVFQRIAVAEGKIHGVPSDDVGFHEVGAVDSIVDIVAACVALELLGKPEVFCSPLFEGSGTIDCAHGRFPIPAPATLEILAGIPLRQIEEPMEFITPTGAALLAEFATGFGPMPSLSIHQIGYGLGTRDTRPRANVLRAVLGRTSAPLMASDTVMQIETNLDDVTPEIAGTYIPSLLALGALDAFITPVQMKKQRPGILLTVICKPEDANNISAWVLRNTVAFGVRMHECRRLKLDREFCGISTPYGEVVLKLGYLGGSCVQASPEFDSCVKLAKECGVTIQEVYSHALGAAVSKRGSRRPA